MSLAKYLALRGSKAGGLFPLSFMIPEMRLGRRCRLMFQMFLYRHRICRSRGEDPEPLYKEEREKMPEGTEGCLTAHR